MNHSVGAPPTTPGLQRVARAACVCFACLLLSSSSLLAQTDIRDPAGDALADARVSRAPDLVRASWESARGVITMTVRLAPGTFDPADVRLVIEIDADEDPSTGRNGAEYQLFVFPKGGRGAELTKAGSSGAAYSAVAAVPVRYIDDGVIVAVPLDVLGHDDGSVRLRVRAHAEAALPIIFDRMPDAGIGPAGSVRAPQYRPPAPSQELPRLPEPDWFAGARRTTDRGVTAPVVLKAPRPRYPPEQTGISAEVQLEARVETDGGIRYARVVRSTRGFDDAALAAAREYEFRPGMQNGAPVPVIVAIVMTFATR